MNTKSKQVKTPKRNRAPKKSDIVLNFEDSTGTDIAQAMEEARVTSKTMPIKSEEPDAAEQPVKPKAKASKTAPEIAPSVGQLFSLDDFLRDNLAAHGGHPKVTTLDIVEKYQAAAKAAGESALPKFQVQRMLRALVFKHFPSAVYSNSTPNGYKGVVCKSLPEGIKAQLKSR